MSLIRAAAMAGAFLLVLSVSPTVAEQPQVARVSVVIGSRLADEGGPQEAAESPLRSPFGVDFDRDGAMFIVELEGGRALERRHDGSVIVIAGDGSKGYEGDGGPAAKATFNGTHNLAISRAGLVYLSDTWNHCVREIDLGTSPTSPTREQGTIRTVAGTGKPGFSGDGGPAAQAEFYDVICVTLNPAEDTLYVADIRNRRIRAIDLGRPEKTVRTVAGNGDKGVPRDGAAAVESPLVDPRAVAPDAAGNLYILERSGHALRVVTPDGTIRTVAGTGKQGFRDGAAGEAEFASPKHVCTDDRGRVYIADDANAAIRCYDPETNTVATILGRAQGDPKIRLEHPHGVTWERGTLYVADSGHNRILRVEFAK
jgi:sugar lactone lactonase YvrE